MCLTVFMFGLDSNTQKYGYRLVLAFNRDEFYARPAKPAAFWPDDDRIIGGRDMTPGKEGGTWLAMSRTGRLAFLLNIRNPSTMVDPDAKGRGSLASDFAKGSQNGADYLEGIAKEGEQYNGFNLVTADFSKQDEAEVHYYCNKSDQPPRKLQPGVHAASNSHLDEPWRKAQHTKDALTDILTNEHDKSKMELTEEILKLMRNDIPLSQSTPLDETSITQEKLYAIAPELVCVKAPIYGTRSHTVILVDTQGEVTYTECYLKEPIDFWNRVWETDTVTFRLNDSEDCTLASPSL